MTKVKIRSPLWIIGSLVSLAAILLGITVGTVLTSKKVPFWPKAEGYISIDLYADPAQEATDWRVMGDGSWNNPHKLDNYTLYLQVCNHYDGRKNTSASIRDWEGEGIFFATGGYGLPGTLGPEDCRSVIVKFTMFPDWDGSLSHATFRVFGYMSQAITIGSGEEPPPEEEECIDSDVTDDYPDGKNYYTKGYVDDFGEDSRWDTCLDENTLSEFYCEQTYGQNRPSRTRSDVYCPEGCDDGVCLGEEPPPEPPPGPTNLSVVTGRNCDVDPPSYSATLSWTGSDGADGYVVDVCDTNDPWSTCQYWTPHNVETQTTLGLTGLDCSRDYYWRVWAYVGDGSIGSHGYPPLEYFSIDCCGEEPEPGTISGTVRIIANNNSYDEVRVWKCDLRDPADPSSGGECNSNDEAYGGADRTDNAEFNYRIDGLINGKQYIVYALVAKDGTVLKNSDHDIDCPTAPGEGRDCVVTVPDSQNFTLEIPSGSGETIGGTLEVSSLDHSHGEIRVRAGLGPPPISIDVFTEDLSPALGDTGTNTVPWLLTYSGWSEGDTVWALATLGDWSTYDYAACNSMPCDDITLAFAIPPPVVGLSVGGLGYSPPSVDAGDNVRFQFTYSNVGDAPLPGSLGDPYLYVKAYVDDELVLEEGIYEGLGAGESREYTTEGSWTATEGSHSVRIVVESPLLDESDTTDNEAVLAMTVPTPAGEGPGEGPGGPAGEVCNVCGCTASGGDCSGQQCNQKCNDCLAKDREWIADENRWEYAYTYTVLGCLPTKPSSFVTWFLRFAMGIGGGIAFLFMVAGTFKVLTSQGDINKLTGGKKMISRAILGILVIVFAVIILRIIGLDILQLPGFSPET